MIARAMKSVSVSAPDVTIRLSQARALPLLARVSAALAAGDAGAVHALLQSSADFALLWPIIGQRVSASDDAVAAALCAPWRDASRGDAGEYAAVATTLVLCKRYDQALAIVDQGLAKAHDLADLHALRGDALRGLKRWNAAARSYAACVGLDARHLRALVNLSGTRMQAGQYDGAVQAARQALAIDPACVDAGVNLGRALIEQQEIGAAMDAFADVAERGPPTALLCTNIARGWRAAGDVMQATTWIDRALQLEPGHVPALVLLGGLAREMGDLDSALTQLTRAAALDADNYEMWSETALILLERGDAAAALAAQQKARALMPEVPAAIAGHANALVAVGDMRAALDAYKQALDVNPMSIAALCGIAQNFPRKLDRTHRERIESLLMMPDLRAQTRSPLHAAMASYYDALEDYPRAAAQTDLANETQWQHRAAIDWRYEPEAFARECDDLMAAFTRESFARLRGMGNDSEAPVFIVGMPRSGTTLLEQILGAHPSALGVGERSQAMLSWEAVRLGRTAVATVAALDSDVIGRAADLHLQRLHALRPPGREVRFYVDKLPDNFRFLGWIALQFPNARVIDLRREGRDVLVSCWMKQFNRLQWSVRPDWIAHRIVQYRRLMAHWTAVSPLRMLRVDYEALASDPERVARGITDFLDLPWDPACLDFHQARRAVRTASVAQVREPVHARSVARWKHYEAHLSAAFAQMAEA